MWWVIGYDIVHEAPVDLEGDESESRNPQLPQASVLNRDICSVVVSESAEASEKKTSSEYIQDSGKQQQKTKT